MRVLRVTPSYASPDRPGSGLNAFYHSKFSVNKTLILTESKNIKYFCNKNDVILKPINVNMGSLAKPDASILFQIFKGYSKILRSLEFLFKALKHIHVFKPELVHLYSPIHLVTGIYCKLVFDSTLVISLHGTDSFRIKKNRVLRSLLLFSDKVLLMSESMRKDINIPNDLGAYLGNGFDDNIFNKNNEVAKNKQIITVGNLRWQKDHHTLIKAFSEFQKIYTDYNLIIVGDGELKSELEDLIESLNIKSKVTLKGALSPHDVASLMKQSEFFCLSSVSEGFPKVILESMACGLPVLTTNVGDISTVVNDAGIIVKPSCVDSLYSGMLAMVDQHKSLKSAISNSNIHLRSWRNITTKLDDIYKSLIAKND